VTIAAIMIHDERRVGKHPALRCDGSKKELLQIMAPAPSLAGHFGL
jgi:hypothetical protein